MLAEDFHNLDRNPFELKAGDIVEKSQHEYVEVIDFSKNGNSAYIFDSLGVRKRVSVGALTLVCPREWRTD